MTASPASAETEGERARRLEKEYHDKTIKPQNMHKWLPEPGRQTVPSMKPAWCDLTSKWKGKIAGTYLDRTLGGVKSRERAGRGGMDEATLIVAAEQLCARPNQPTWQKQTGYVVQSFVNQTGLSTKDAIASIRARLSKSWKSDRRAFCSKLSLSAEASPAQKHYHKAQQLIYGCRSYDTYWQTLSNHWDKDLLWDVDKRAEVDSEVLRAYVVLGCLGDGRRGKHKPAHDNIGRLAMCGVDARRLDSTRLKAELARPEHNLYSRTIARETFALAAAAAQRFKTRLAKLGPAYVKVFHTAPEAAWNKWVADYQANKQAIEGARQFEVKLYGPSRSALVGCRKQLRAAMATYLASQTIRSTKRLDEVLAGNVAGVLVDALLPCAGREADRWEGETLLGLLRKVRNPRGPRMAAFYGALDALQDVLKDRPRFPLNVKALGHMPAVPAETMYYRLLHERKLLSGGVGKKAQGTVAKLRKTKHGIRIVFKRVRVKVPNYRCVDTNRILRIDHQGRVHYRQVCTFLGYVWVDRTEKPVTIPADLAAGIRRGSFVTLRADYAFERPGYVRRGYPNLVYRSHRQKRLVAAYGFKL